MSVRKNLKDDPSVDQAQVKAFMGEAKVFAVWLIKKFNDLTPYMGGNWYVNILSCDPGFEIRTNHARPIPFYQ